MPRKIPPFAAIRAFEAAARHSSFKKAAEELLITSSAVSHQIKSLEEYLGTQLFIRGDRRPFLTEIGQTFLAGVENALDQLADATSAVIQKEAQSPLTIQLYLSFAQLWLMPRLGSLRQAHPDLDVCIITIVEPSELPLVDADVAILYGDGDWPNMRVNHLLAEEIFPVCSPAYLAEAPPLNNPEDLTRHLVIHYRGQPGEWRDWLAFANAQDVDPGEGMQLDTRALTQQAALDGLGVTLARRPFINDDFATGRLIAPFSVCLPSSSAYYLICPKSRARLPKIVAFRDWILSECVKDGAAMRPVAADGD